MTNTVTHEHHTYIQNAIENGCTCVVEIIDYIENTYDIRYTYEKVLHELYELR